MNLIKDLISGHADDRTHAMMTRYGRGIFEGPAAAASISGNRLRLQGSYMYVPVLGQLLGDRCASNLSVQGIIISKADLRHSLEDYGLEVLDATMRGGMKYKVAGSLSGRQLSALYEDLWEAAVLVKAKCQGFSLTTAPSIPKPNNYNDPSFCGLTMPASQENQLAAFGAIAPGMEPSTFGSLSVKHTIKIEELCVPEGLSGKPASLVRLEAKRRGVLTRQLVVDGRSIETVHRFLV